MKILSISLLLGFIYQINCSFEDKQTIINKQNQIQLEKVADIILPDGFTRIKLKEGSFAAYLRNFPIRKNDSIVSVYNGTDYWNQSTHFAILDLSVGERDLQQCADAVMRLRAEYLYKNKDYSKIHFNFTNGQQIDYILYAEGNRISFKGNKAFWSKKSVANYSHDTFLKYMNLIFSYAGSYSLNKELKSVENPNKIMPGDVFIESKKPYGHAVIVMDVAENRNTKERIFLIAQSYMPAQDVHILINPKNKKWSPWYSINFDDELYTPEWTFKKIHLKTFE